MSVPNIEKLFQYLQCFSVKPIEYAKNVDEELVSIGDLITDIRLNRTFFYNDACYMCGGCDPAESNLFTSSEYEIIKNCSDSVFLEAGLEPSYLYKLRDKLYKISCIINGQVIDMYVYKQESNELFLPTRDKILKRCSWCFQDTENKFKCRIHPVESITCIMPHLRTYHVKGTNKSSVGISQFGRNWALKCPVILTPPSDESEFNRNKYNRISKLQRLYQVGLDLNIDTHLPQVIAYVENTDYFNYKSKLNINILSKRPRLLF